MYNNRVGAACINLGGIAEVSDFCPKELGQESFLMLTSKIYDTHSVINQKEERMYAMYFPDYKSLKSYELNYKMIPVGKEIYADSVTPIALLKKIATLDDRFYLLESVEDGVRAGRYSFIGYNPILKISSKKGVTTVKSGELSQSYEEDAVLSIKKILKQYESPKIEGMPMFTGGLVGYFSYEFICYAEPSLNIRRSDDNDYSLMLFDKVIAYDNLKQKIIVIVNYKACEGEKGYEKATLEIEKMIHLIRNVGNEPVKTYDGKVKFECNTSKEEYCNMVEKTKKYITEGDIFQTVVSRKFEAPYGHNLINAYRVLRTTNPSPYMYYLKDDDVTICGASPETMVKVIDGKITTFPVAGTRKRGASVTEDEKLEKELLADEKELAEHNMLVDLARNDVGKISEFGSVKVEEYMKIHRFSRVMHIASVVTGKLKRDKDSVDAITALLPAGTLSGAPKFRACEIIDELEVDTRGIYGGCIGYIDLSGNLDMCIAIRTAFLQNNKVTVQAGAGIVADSVPENEYEECYNKAFAVMDAIMRASEVD